MKKISLILVCAFLQGCATPDESIDLNRADIIKGCDKDEWAKFMAPSSRKTSSPTSRITNHTEKHLKR